MSAATPLSLLDRVERYYAQNGVKPPGLSGWSRLTPRQMRRINKKEHRAWGRLDKSLRGDR